MENSNLSLTEIKKTKSTYRLWRSLLITKLQKWRNIFPQYKTSETSLTYKIEVFFNK